MGNWTSKIKVKHLLTQDEDLETVQANMSAVADVLSNDRDWNRFRHLHKFRQIPPGDDFFGPADYANKLLDYMYDYADDNGIWIE